MVFSTPSSVRPQENKKKTTSQRYKRHPQRHVYSEGTAVQPPNQPPSQKKKETDPAITPHLQCIYMKSQQINCTAVNYCNFFT